MGMSEPGNANRSAIVLARWSDRFIAWLIDAVILTVSCISTADWHVRGAGL